MMNARVAAPEREQPEQASVYVAALPRDSSFEPRERPSLAKHHALDLCAQDTWRSGGHMLVLVSPGRDAADLLARLSGRDVRCLAVDELAATPAAVQSAIWLDPHPHELPVVLRQLRAVLLPGGRIYLLCADTAAVLQRRNGAPTPTRALDLSSAVRGVRAAKLRVISRYGFMGLTSIGWGLAEKLCVALRTDRLADRCHVAMRAAYVVQGWRAAFAPVGLVVAAHE